MTMVNTIVIMLEIVIERPATLKSAQQVELLHILTNGSALPTQVLMLLL